jgi:succinate dehydrogenase / fumarate reductase, cytochrome b subunit
MAKENFLNSSIGKKIIVGLTGLFLISFLVVHVGINTTILFNDNGETFNSAAHFMSHNWVIRVMEIGLLVGLLAHIGMTLKLYFENKATRPVGYAVTNGNANSKWYSRSMTLLGTLLLIFLVLHMADFWWHTKKSIYITGEEENPFIEVRDALQQWYILIPYLLGFFALGFHLLHGFPSAFQTLGLNHKKYTPVIKFLGTAFSIVVPGLFSAIALAIFFRIVE